jgi:Na+-driven multidrug efflux pump
VDLLLISIAYKDNPEALAIVGFAALVRFLCLTIAIYFSQACITKISGLMGAKKLDQAEQVVADLFRFAFLSMCVFTVAFRFISYPLLIFMGLSHENAVLGTEYLYPILIAMPFIASFQLACGFLQSEGRSLLCGLMQFIGFALNCGCLAPIMLFWVKVPVQYAGVSFALAQSLVGIGLVIAIFCGRFGLKPKVRQLVRPFLKDSFHALLLALPFLINVLAATLPPMLLLTEMMAAARSHHPPMDQEVGPVFSVFIKLNSAINSISIGMCQGFLGAGSYAHGAENHRRHLQLFGFCILITWLYHLALMPIMVFKTRWPCSIWLTGAQLNLSEKMIKIAYYTNTLIPLNFGWVNFLLTMRKPIIPLILTLIRGSLYVAYTFILYETKKNDPVRMMFAYNMDDVTLFLLGAMCALPSLIGVMKADRHKMLVPLLQTMSEKKYGSDD